MKKSDYFNNFDGSYALFCSCWADYLKYRRYMEIDDIQEFLNDRASEKVNDSKSQFYIYG